MQAPENSLVYFPGTTIVKDYIQALIIMHASSVLYGDTIKQTITSIVK